MRGLTDRQTETPALDAVKSSLCRKVVFIWRFVTFSHMVIVGVVVDRFYCTWFLRKAIQTVKM